MKKWNKVLTGVAIGTVVVSAPLLFYLNSLNEQDKQGIQISEGVFVKEKKELEDELLPFSDETTPYMQDFKDGTIGLRTSIFPYSYYESYTIAVKTLDLNNTNAKIFISHTPSIGPESLPYSKRPIGITVTGDTWNKIKDHLSKIPNERKNKEQDYTLFTLSKNDNDFGDNKNFHGLDLRSLERKMKDGKYTYRDGIKANWVRGKENYLNMVSSVFDVSQINDPFFDTWSIGEELTFENSNGETLNAYVYGKDSFVYQNEQFKTFEELKSFIQNKYGNYELRRK